jgi:hypothetical protein
LGFLFNKYESNLTLIENILEFTSKNKLGV